MIDFPFYYFINFVLFPSFRKGKRLYLGFGPEFPSSSPRQAFFLLYVSLPSSFIEDAGLAPSLGRSPSAALLFSFLLPAFFCSLFSDPSK